MSIPVRVQRSRAKGWRMPENTVYVGRGTRWGNPWIVDWRKATTPPTNQYRETPAEAVELYRPWIAPDTEEVRAKLAGKNLACWCPLHQACHADVLLEIANGDRLPIGTPVRYWPGVRRGEGRLSVTRTPIWKMGSGTEVASVEGYSGGIDLTHIEIIAGSEDA